VPFAKAFGFGLRIAIRANELFFLLIDPWIPRRLPTVAFPPSLLIFLSEIWHHFNYSLPFSLLVWCGRCDRSVARPVGGTFAQL